MADLDRTESARWSQAVNKTMGKFTETTEATLADAASRGFAAPPGAALTDIMAMGQEAKLQLVEAGGKIYDEQRQVIYDREATILKLAVGRARLAMELYRADIFNTLELEQAQVEAVLERQGADIDRLLSQIEGRQAAIIRNQAAAQQEVLVWKRLLVQTQTETLPFEKLLIDTEVQTAEKRLEIITSIYQVLAAQEIVLTAERRRAAALGQVAEAEKIVAAVKQTMVPYYLKKAAAEEQLAGVVAVEAEAKKGLELIGYDKLKLRWSQEEADHLIRLAENDYELLRGDAVRTDRAAEVARTQARTTLQEYANTVRAQILEIKKALAEGQIDLNLSTRLTRLLMETDKEIQAMNNETLNLNLELPNVLKNLIARAEEEENTAKASANTMVLSASTTLANTKRILRG